MLHYRHFWLILAEPVNNDREIRIDDIICNQIWHECDSDTTQPPWWPWSYANRPLFSSHDHLPRGSRRPLNGNTRTKNQFKIRKFQKILNFLIKRPVIMPLDNIQFDIVEPNYKIKMTSKPNSKSDNRTFIIIAIIRIKVVYDILNLM